MKAKITLLQAALFITAIMIFTTVSIAQVTEEWVARYNSPGNMNDAAASIAVDIAGNVYITGESEVFGTNSSEYATIKYNSFGDTLWVQLYNGPGNSTDGASSLAVDDSGNVYVTGRSTGSGTEFDYATIKYDSSGIQQWESRYNGPGNNVDKAYSIAIDGSGNVHVTGASTGNGTYLDYVTIKYNSLGDTLWVQAYNGPGNNDDEAISIAVDDSGNVYVTGYSEGSGTSYDYATIKYDSAGVQQWEARYNGLGNDFDFAFSIAVDDSGNVYVTGSSKTGSNFGTENYATIKYNSSGIEQWVQSYNGPGNFRDVARSLALDDSCNVYVTGYSYGSGTEDDYATLKYNSSGVQVWISRYNHNPGNWYDVATSLAVDGLGNVYVTGTSYGGNGTVDDYATLKYNSSGVQQWVQRYNGTGNWNDQASSIAVDGSGNVYVTGWSIGAINNQDYATIKYSQMVGISPISNQIQIAFHLEQNYPNPFSGSTVISFSLFQSQIVSIKIFDLNGRLVTSLDDKIFEAGENQIEFNAEKINAGIYFLRMETATYSENQKLIVTK